MIRINLAKAFGGKKGGGGKPASGIVWALFILLLLTGGGVYYYMVYIQPEGFEKSAIAKTLNNWTPDMESVLAFVASLTEKPDKPAAVEKNTGKPKTADTPKAKAADTAEKPSAEASQTAGIPEKPDASAPKVADAAEKLPDEAPRAVGEPEKTVAAPKAKLADALEITYPDAPKTAAAPEKPAEPKQADAPKKVSPPAPKPSSLVRSNMAEDVVKEFDNETRAIAASKTAVTYAEMTVAEKINYEVMFGRNAFEMVTRCAPPGTKLKTLEIENFQTIYASGAGASREMVQEMFAAFRKERGELLPKPFSHIKDSEKGGYQFVITHKPLFGTEPNDPFQAIDYIGFKGGLQASLTKFSRAAGANGVKITAAPVQASVEQAGQYMRFVYKVSGESTYQNFRKFVLALYGEKVTCAFKKVTMTPIKDEQVRVNMEILFTVKN